MRVPLAWLRDFAPVEGSPEELAAHLSDLGLSEDHDGILVLPAGLLPGDALTEALGITPDVVFDLDVTPNRPDALSILGVARDLAARLKVPLAIPDPVVPRNRHDATGTV